ncbi:MAG: HAMP domain-containing protein [Deltaproteobacteria bacterium]|nr:HAMP domain-containing protein [Deltaproteobacteria bacterium]
MTLVRKGRSLRRRIVLVVMLAMLAVLGTLGALGYASITQSVDRSLQERLLLAQAAADHLDTILHDSASRLEDLSSSVPASNFAEAATNPRLGAIFNEGVFLLDKSGLVLQAEPLHKGWKGLALGQNLVVRQAMDEHAPTVSNLLRDGPWQRGVVLMVVPAGKVEGAGYVGGAMDPTHALLQDVIQTRRPGSSGYTDLVDNHGAVLASSDSSRVLSVHNHGDFVANLIRERRPSVGTCHSCHKDEPAPKREKEVVAFAPLAFAPWAVVVRQSEAEAFAPAKVLQTQLFILGLVLVGAGLVLAMITAQSVIKPIETLTKTAHRIAEGNLSDPVPDTGQDELGRLGQAFDVMRVQLKGSMERIQQWTRELESRVKERTSQLEESEEERKELLRRVMSAQEGERKKIARELHDETSQELTALVMGLEAAHKAPPSEMFARIDQLKALAVRTLEGVHRVMLDLRPSILDDLGLQSAIRWYAENRLEPLGMDVSVETRGTDRRLPAEVETAVFRVLQEAVNNAAEHSEAGRVNIVVEFGEDAIRVFIEDDGCGFDPALARGMGMMGMRERVTLLGGRFELVSKTGKGTLIALEVPIDVKDQGADRR